MANTTEAHTIVCHLKCHSSSFIRASIHAHRNWFPSWNRCSLLPTESHLHMRVRWSQLNHYTQILPYVVPVYLSFIFIFEGTNKSRSIFIPTEPAESCVTHYIHISLAHSGHVSCVRLMSFTIFPLPLRHRCSCLLLHQFFLWFDVFVCACVLRTNMLYGIHAPFDM